MQSTTLNDYSATQDGATADRRPTSRLLSTPAVNQVWLNFAKTYNLDLDSMLASSHGVQTHMTFRKYLPPMSEEALCVRH